MAGLLVLNYVDVDPQDLVAFSSEFNSFLHWDWDQKSCLDSYTSRFCPLYRRANEQQRVRRDWISFHLLLVLERRRLRRLPKRDCRLCQQDGAGRGRGRGCRRF